MQSGISIMDLGLNEFLLDLLEYAKQNGDMDKVPFGLHAVVPASEDCPPGVAFVLKNRNSGVNIDMQNRLRPFYMVYIGTDGEVVCDHLSPKLFSPEYFFRLPFYMYNSQGINAHMTIPFWHQRDMKHEWCLCVRLCDILVT